MFNIPRLVNPHTHLREGDVLRPLVALAYQGGVSVLGPMPNTGVGLTGSVQVRMYLDECREGVPAGAKLDFIGIMQMTELTTAKEIEACMKAGIRDAKVYPLNRTTKSHNGVRDYAALLSVVEYAGRVGMRVHFHPEHPNMLIDNRDAEYLFIPIIDLFMKRVPDTVIVWEHGTDARCVPFWEEWAETGRFFVTITAHHLLSNESEAYGDVGSVCKPPYKKEVDRRGLVELIGKDYSWVMAGGDDAPHPKDSKHKVGPCACGAYTAPFLLPLYAHALSHLLKERPIGGETAFVNFTSGNACKLYELPTPPSVALEAAPQTIPLSYEVGPWTVEPFWAGREIGYSLQ